MTDRRSSQQRLPFNSPTETGLRAVTVLTEAFPAAYDLQRLLFFDYVTVHSADLAGGPASLHPATPHRSGEILIKRGLVERGLILYWSRGLIERRFDPQGFLYAATEQSASFLDSLSSPYAQELRARARWVVESLGELSAEELQEIVGQHLDQWGAEFEFESVLDEGQ